MQNSLKALYIKKDLFKFFGVMNFQCSYQCQQSHGLFFTFIIFWPFKMEESFTDWCWNNCILIVEVHLKWLTHLNRQDNMKMSRVCFYFSKCKVLEDGFHLHDWARLSSVPFKDKTTYIYGFIIWPPNQPCLQKQHHRWLQIKYKEWYEEDNPDCRFMQSISNSHVKWLHNVKPASRPHP